MANVMDVRTVADARALLSQLDERECRLSEQLDQLLDQQTQMDVKMASFRQMIPTLHTLHNDSSELCDAVSRASALAESVSSKVRLLDQAKSHVYAAMKRVDDVIDLKSCADGFQFAMNSADYEKAAAHIHRYLSLDESMLVDGGIPEASQGVGSSTVESSFDVLRENERKLQDLVRERFRDAVDGDDWGGVERFGRLFPLLNLHKEGLDLYTRYLRRKMRMDAEKSLVDAGQASDGRVGVVYADTLTLLYEGVACLVEKHSPLIETYYGPDWILPLIKSLQVECDELVARILQQLQEERLLDHKVQTVNIALKARAAVGAIRPDVLQLDSLLAEISICSSRTELYFRFIRKKVDSISVETGREGTDDIIKNSKTNLLIQELIGKYILLENYFMRESLNKAVAMDTCDPDGHTSSMADDIFFVLQKCTRRAFTSSNVDGACSMLNHASSLLLTEYLDVLRSRLKNSFPSAGLDLSGMLQSKLQSTRSMSVATSGENEPNKPPDTSVAMNDVEVSIDNIMKLSRELQGASSKMSELLGDGAKMKLNSCLADFSSVAASFKELRLTGINQVVQVFVMSRLTPSLSVYSSSISHILTDGELANYEVNDPFVLQLITAIESLLTSIKVRYLSGVYDLLLNEVITKLAVELENQVFQAQFNQLGGIQLDKDLRCLINYLSTLAQWPVRDKFARLLQLATLLSLEHVSELKEYWGERAGPLMWRLTPMEVRKALRLRVDFTAEEIALLKL